MSPPLHIPLMTQKEWSINEKCIWAPSVNTVLNKRKYPVKSTFSVTWRIHEQFSSVFSDVRFFVVWYYPLGVPKTHPQLWKRMWFACQWCLFVQDDQKRYRALITSLLDDERYLMLWTSQQGGSNVSTLNKSPWDSRFNRMNVMASSVFLRWPVLVLAESCRPPSAPLGCGWKSNQNWWLAVRGAKSQWVRSTRVEVWFVFNGCTP